MNDELKAKVAETYALERKALETTKEAIIEIVKQLSRPITMDGVKPVSSSPRCVTVSLSTIMQNKFNLSAEYYISEAQLEKIIKKIEAKKTLTDIREFLEKTLKDGYIAEKSSSHKVQLNPAVRKELEDVLASIQEEPENDKEN